MTTKKPAAKKNPMQADVPPIDRTAETLEPVDVPMPTIENAPGSIFVPKSNIGTSDMLELTLMYLLHLTGSPLRVETGALRQVPLPAERVEQLSERARAHMQQLAPPVPAPAPDAPAETTH